MKRHVLVTGATGLIGGSVLERLLRGDPALHAYVLVRSPDGWRAAAERLGALHTRATAVRGDLTAPGLGLDRAVRQRLAGQLSAVVHCAADTGFSRTLDHARRHNRDGTARVLELAAECRGLQRLVHLSTAFVAGCMTGRVPEAELPDVPGWVNAYEQSKHEAEQLVRGSGLPWLILRSSTVVCDGPDGRISQLNAVHRALELYRAGLAAMVPGDDASRVDLVTTDHVAGATTRLTLGAAPAHLTLHLCAGEGAITLGDLLDRAYAQWQAEPRWRRRAVARPALATLETYRLFEQAVAETGDARLRTITHSLTHFVPQLALPKLFDTRVADTLLGYRAAPVESFLDRMLVALAARRGSRGRAA